MGKEKAQVNIVVVGHVDSEKPNTEEPINMPIVVEIQADEMI